MRKKSDDNSTQAPYKYIAFISYNSKDGKWGKRLQSKLERYRLPSALCSARGWERKPIKPVFFAPTDIQPGPLSEEVQGRLKASRNLIVICSPNSAQSEWVGREIEFFHSIGRTKNIHFFIVDGIPNSGKAETECFNPVIKKIGLPEILGANINERNFKWAWINRERAYVQLISKLLDVEFDTIWKRHKRRLVQKITTWVVGILAILAAFFVVWSKGVPVNVAMKLNETSAYNENLPPLENAVVTLAFKNETKSDTVNSFDETALFNNIPQEFLNEPVRITVKCRNFMELDTILPLKEKMILDIRRDPSIYGNIMFDVWDDNGCGVENIRMVIAGQEVISGKNGHVELFVPMEQQSEKYHIVSSVPLVRDTIDMPCGEDNIICIK